MKEKDCYSIIFFFSWKKQEGVSCWLTWSLTLNSRLDFIFLSLDLLSWHQARHLDTSPTIHIIIDLHSKGPPHLLPHPAVSENDIFPSPAICPHFITHTLFAFFLYLSQLFYPFNLNFHLSFLYLLFSDFFLSYFFFLLLIFPKMTTVCRRPPPPQGPVIF